MTRFSQAARRFVVAVAAVSATGLAVTDVAFAQGMDAPSVVVPSQPGPLPAPVPTYGPDGCFRVNQALYGPYHMTFCIQGRSGSYQVTGAGLNCRGSLRTYPGGHEVRITLRRSHCGNGMDWTADTMYCQIGGPGGYLDRPNAGGGGGLDRPSVVVPTPGPRPAPVPSYATQLQCSYQPAVGGYPSVTFVADRYR